MERGKESKVGKRKGNFFSREMKGIGREVPEGIKK